MRPTAPSRGLRKAPTAAAAGVPLRSGSDAGGQLGLYGLAYFAAKQELGLLVGKLEKQKKGNFCQVSLTQVLFPPSAIRLGMGSGGNLPLFPRRGSSPVWGDSQHHPRRWGFSRQQDLQLPQPNRSGTGTVPGPCGRARRALLLPGGWQRWRTPRVSLPARGTPAKVCGQRRRLVGEELRDRSTLHGIAVGSNRQHAWSGNR